MKKLILPLILLNISLFATANAAEVVEPNDGKAVASKIKDLEIEDMLSQTSEFRKCREDNKFQAGDSPTVKNDKIAKAEKCFQDQLKSKSGNAEELGKLSDNLNLQTFGLVKSKNVSDIQKYLNNKMYKAMTGVDRETMNEKQIVESLKFKNKKHIDQGLFIKMYETQVTKNALFEVSKFCFEKLRIKDNQEANFAKHWKNFNGSLAGLELEDDGLPTFGTITDTKDKDKIYADIFESIKIGDGGGIPTAQLSNFFIECGKQIAVLCDEFKRDDASIDISQKVSDTSVGYKNGAAACLAKSKILEYKQVLANVKKTKEYFEKELAANPNGVADKLLNGEPIKNFGTGADDESLDNLTNYTSDDVLNGGASNNELAEQKADKCTQDASLTNCKDFIMEGESIEKVKHDVEHQMTLKREIEMERVRAIAKDKVKLKDYLKENGYFTLLDEMEKNKLSDDAIVEAIGKEFEAKKVALLVEINSKLGKRQVSEADSKDKTKVEAAANETIKQSKEERARLAQVVLFNNIITSHLSLKRGGTETVRNVNAWKKEELALKNKGVNEQYFENLKAKDEDSSGGARGNESMQGMSLIDQLLGGPDATANNQNGLN